ncbi:craniofacial development protein 2-like [Montipora capricornis]|uniref:craniofacial development protein 2-like n=1 Tax=Montipora capricornis TaxID=246305 RepID=UPI0035F1B63B
MANSNESLSGEVRAARCSLLGPKAQIRIGAWNVRTMYETSKSAQVLREMSNYNLDILGVSECRWTGSGRQRSADGSVILYSGHEDTHTNGVALIIAKKSVNTLLEWEPINDRILRARFDSKHCKLTIIQCYAPTNEADDAMKDDWYDHLIQVLSKVPRHHLLVVIGDLNAKVGADNVKVSHGQTRLCLNNDPVIGGTIFPHKNIHKLTWRSPNGRSLNQIDHIIINGKWRRSLENVRVFRGADAASDHNLVVATAKLKLRKAMRQEQQRKQFDIAKLRCPKIQKQFVLEVKNRFQVLAGSNQDDTPVETKWNRIKNTFYEAAASTVGYKKKNNKQWLTPEPWEKIEERKIAEATRAGPTVTCVQRQRSGEECQEG